LETKLFVGNLHFSISEEKLEEMFTEAGNVVSVTIIKDRDSGRSKGFAFIEMSNQVEVEEAVRRYNEFEINGRSLKVSIARPQEKRGRYQKRGGSRYDDRRRRDRKKRKWNDNRYQY
jgi:RNA recognition motif-containing protein